MREIATDEAVTINELASKALTGQNTVSAVVTRLEEARLARRSRASSDGRVVTVSATAAGRRLLQRAPEPATARVLGVLCALSANELRTVTRALTILNDGLGLDRDAETGMLFEADPPLTGARQRRARGTKKSSR